MKWLFAPSSTRLAAPPVCTIGPDTLKIGPATAPLVWVMVLVGSAAASNVTVPDIVSVLVGATKKLSCTVVALAMVTPATPLASVRVPTPGLPGLLIRKVPVLSAPVRFTVRMPLASCVPAPPAPAV